MTNEIELNGKRYRVVPVDETADEAPLKESELGEVQRVDKGQANHFVYGDGSLGQYCDVSDNADNNQAEYGNYYHTEAEAIAARDRHQLLERALRVRDAIRRETESMPPARWAPVIHGGKLTTVSTALAYSPWSFVTENDLDRFITALGDDNVRALLTMGGGSDE